MNLTLPPEAEAFRAQIRSFLEDYRELEGFFMQDRKWSEVKAFFQEVGRRGWLSMRLSALNSTTWNIPTIAGRHLLVRNDRQAICFVLPQRTASD